MRPDFIKNCMFFNFNGTKIYYDFWGVKSNRPTLLLHGWGRSSQDFDYLIQQFPERCFLAIDFPPFGKSNQEVEGWSIFTYAQMVMSLCQHLKIESVDILAHSFGVRVATILSAVECSLVHSCIFTGGAGMKPKRSIKYHYKVLRYKFCKKFGKNTDGQGSKDYLALSPAMKKVFVSVVQTHLEEYAKTINCPCLLIWGKNDDQTPMYMAERLKKLIKNSELKVIDGAGHFAFLDCPLQFFAFVKQFWEEG